MTTLDLDRYFARIGYTGPRTPTLEALTGIHAAHTTSIPFENLDPLLGRPVRLDTASLQAKLIDSHRGGYCYEHNLLLAGALRLMGFRPLQLAARVLWGSAENIVRPRSHMLLMVEIDKQRVITDVGFGGTTLPRPLRLDDTPPQDTPFGRYRLQRDGIDFILQAELGDEWRAMYRFDLQPQQQVDYELTSWYLCHHPESAFIRTLRVARIGNEGRLNLLDNRLSVIAPGGVPQVSWLTSVAELRRVLEDRFGIDLRGLDGLDSKLAPFAARPPELD